MLPITMERLSKQLIRWGYPSYLVENMKPWRLLSCYVSQKKKREARKISDPNLVMSKAIMDIDVISKKTKRRTTKYRGAKVLYRRRHN